MPDQPDTHHWRPLSLDRVRALMAGYDRPWWICGGRAIDLFVGRTTREHGDTDVGVCRCDLLALREHLRGWDPHKTKQPTPSKLAPWPPGQPLPREGRINNVWLRRGPGKPWCVDFTIMDTDGDRWVFRRDDRIGGRLDELTMATADGLRYLRPEIQLLYKSRPTAIRPKDEADFAACLPHLDDRARRWLASGLRRVAADHGWLVFSRTAGKKLVRPPDGS